MAAARSARAHAASASADVESFVDAVEAAHVLLRSVAEQALAELGNGVTSTQLRLLDRLQRLGESRLIDLADVLSIAPSTATRLCDTLADRQLIARHRRGRDRRELQIELTDAGTRLLDSVRRRTVAGWDTLVQRLPATDRRAIETTMRQLAAPPTAATADKATA